MGGNGRVTRCGAHKRRQTTGPSAPQVRSARLPCIRRCDAVPPSRSPTTPLPSADTHTPAHRLPPQVDGFPTACHNLARWTSSATYQVMPEADKPALEAKLLGAMVGRKTHAQRKRKVNGVWA